MSSSSMETRKRTHLQDAQQTVFDSARRQVGDVTDTAREAVTSAAWMYPVYGALYIVSHPKLIGPVLPVLLRALLISAGILAACFFFLYLPQVAWLALFTGPLAFIAAVPLVLGEAYVVINFFGKNFLLGQLNTDIFDAVLVNKGCTALVEKGRPITAQKGHAAVLGKVLTRPLSKFSTDNVVRYLLTLPLNLIPVVGTVFFVGYNGYKAGPGYHARYFQLRGFDKARRDDYIKRYRGAYTAFGTVAMLFNLIPVVSVVLSLATSAGAAIWAADMEGKSPSQENEVDVALPGVGQ